MKNLKKLVAAALTAATALAPIACADVPLARINPVKSSTSPDDGHACVVDADCDAGYSCWAGCCEPDFVPGDGGNETGTEVCAELVPEELVTPTVLLVVDGSGSMKKDLGQGSRWTVLRDALMGDGGVVAQMSDAMSFGFVSYSSNNMCGDGRPQASVTFDDLASAYDANHIPDGFTPTGLAIAYAADHLAAMDSNEPKLILLATDGNANTCDDSKAYDEGQSAAVDEAEAAQAAGINTVVLGVSDEIAADNVQEIANVGAGLDADGSEEAAAYFANDANQLVVALEDMLQREELCVIKLDQPVDSDSAEATVTLDGEALAEGDSDGWTFRDDNHIQLMGEACDRRMAGAEVAGHVTCPVQPEVPAIY
jgi:von Willebrand factor type A domain